MPIETIERFYCELCHFTSIHPNQVKKFKETGVCPRCQDDREYAWELLKQDAIESKYNKKPGFWEDIFHPTGQFGD